MLEDIFIPLPDTTNADRSVLIGTAQWLRATVRPAIYSHMAALISRNPDDYETHTDYMMTELWLQEVEAYSLAIDERIARTDTLKCSEEMPFTLHKVDSRTGQASAITDFYYSPTTRGIVHGPDALRQVLALGENLFRTDEDWAILETAHWRRIIVSNLHVSMQVLGDDGTGGFTEAQRRQACIYGRLLTTDGRRVEYLGKPVDGYPIKSQSGYNALATRILGIPSFSEAVGLKDHPLKSDISNQWRTCLNESRSFTLFMLVELLGLLTGSRISFSRSTHLLVKLCNVPAPADFGDLLISGLSVDYARNFNQGRANGQHLITVPFEFAFRPLQASLTTGLMAITHLSIPELMAIDARISAPHTATTAMLPSASERRA